MKQKNRDLLRPPVGVASRAEAWIETHLPPSPSMGGTVASRAEAWIETSQSCRSSNFTGVASRAEAWIETLKHHKNKL